MPLRPSRTPVRRQPAPGGNEGSPAYDSGPPVAPTDTGPTLSPIGVAPDYIAAVRPTGNILPTQGVPGGPGAGQVRPTAPRYMNGDEWTLFVGMSPETIALLQEQLQEAGYIGVGTNVNYGSWDGTTASAMREILAVANVQGSDWEAAFQSVTVNAPGYLTQAREADAAAAAEKAERERKAREPTPLGPPPLTNPDELRAVVQQVARRTVGRKVDEQWVNQFISQYQAMESARFSDQQWDPDSGQWIPRSREAATPPDLAAEKALLGDYGDEAGAMATLNVMDQFLQIVAKPGV